MGSLRLRTGGGTTARWLKPEQKPDLRMRRVVLGLMGRGGCRLDPHRRCEESERLLRTVHRIQAGCCRDGRAQHLRDVYWSRSHQRETETGWLEAGGRGGHLETGWRVGDKAELTHGRTHIQCSWSRSCRPSARGRRRRFPWSYKPPCGSLRRPACQKPAPGR